MNLMRRNTGGEKRLLLGIIWMMILLCVYGCAQNEKIVSDTEDVGSAERTVQSPWYEAFDLETDHVTIYYEQDESFSSVEITDAEQVEKLVDAVDWCTWESVSLENQYSATPYFYIDFHNGTVISLLNDIAYGSVGRDITIEKDDDGTIITVTVTEAQGPFTQNEELLQAVQQIVA